MPKRAAGLSQVGVRSGRNKLHQATRSMFEPLETRVFLSATASSTAVDVEWNGSVVRAIPNQYLAQTQNPGAFQKLAAAQGFTEIRVLGGDGFYQFTTDLTSDAVSALAKAHKTALPLVEPNYIVSKADTLPNDTYAPAQWHLNNTGQTEPFDYNLNGTIETNPNESQIGTPGLDTNLKKAWDITTGSSSVIVAVLDTGVDINHPDLSPNIWSNPFYDAGGTNATAVSPEGFVNDLHGWNFVSNNNNVLDDEGHGTNVAGIIGAVGNNTVGVSGVNWNVKILPVKVLGSDGFGTEADIIAGINYVVSLKSAGINVVAMNESLGGSGFPVDLLANNAIRAAGQVGVLDVVAAGNDSENNDKIPHSPANFSQSRPNVITVAAVDNRGQLANFSDYGASSVLIAAPGIKILSTAPSYDISNSDPLTGLINTGNPDPVDPANPVTIPYGYESGTSQATPQIAGIIALEAAANPSATMMQLKNALLSSAKFDPYLDSVNGLPPKVATSGIADAYVAVRNVLNNFVISNTDRQGNWPGFYGKQGAYVVGDSTAFPSFVTASIEGATPVLVDNSTKSQRGLVKVSDTNDRILAYEGAGTSETINLDFTDGQVHRVSLYMVNADHKARTQYVQLIDPTTGSVVDTQTVSKGLKDGQYLTYDLRGQVKLVITKAAGPDATFSGIFFDPQPTAPGGALGTDATTKGKAWRTQYGSQGSFVVGDSAINQLPGYVTGLTPTSNSTTVLGAKSSSAVGLQKVVDTDSTIRAYWSSTTSFDINLTVNDALVHWITFYVADFQNQHRSERIDQYTGDSTTYLATTDVTDFAKGKFITFAYLGNTLFHVTNTGPTDAVVSGVFFDAPPGEAVHYDGVDTSTMGDWKSVGYGPANAFIVGDNFNGSENALVPSITGATEYILSQNSRDPRALLKNDSGAQRNRVAAYLYSNTTMTFTYSPADLAVHRVELYFVDYQNLNRKEGITITSLTTGAVVAHQRISHFQKGVYLIYDIRGPVSISIHNEAYPNAVLSGLFTD